MARACSVLLLGAVALAACGRSTTGTLPAACQFPDGPRSIEKALASAPGIVRIDGTRLSQCLVREADAADVQSVGAAYVSVAGDLADRARQAPRGPAATQLGYLVGAVRRGAAKTAGIHAELQRRMEQEAGGIEGSPRFQAGERAGQASG